MIFDKTKKIHEQITEETWTKETFYRNSDGVPCYHNEDNDDIGKACAVGWLCAIYDKEPSESELYSESLYKKLQETPTVKRIGTPEPFGMSISSINDDDNTSFVDVLQMFKEADL